MPHHELARTRAIGAFAVLVSLKTGGTKLMSENEQVSKEEGQGISHRLALEIALLAMHFGWTEHETLSLPSIRRQTYVGILSDLCGGFEEALRLGATNRLEVERILRADLMNSLKIASGESADKP